MYSIVIFGQTSHVTLYYTFRVNEPSPDNYFSKHIKAIIKLYTCIEDTILLQIISVVIQGGIIFEGFPKQVTINLNC